MLRQLMAATMQTAIVDGHVEGPASGQNVQIDARHRVTQTRTSGNVNAELASLRLSGDVPARETTVVAAGDVSRTTPQRHFVVVAIDFGTALSGYAFAFVRDPCRAIHMMRRWDGGDPGVVNQKTPSTLLLDPLGRFHSFGYTARDFYHDLDDDEARQWLFFDKFKMTLHHNSDVRHQYSLRLFAICVLAAGVGARIFYLYSCVCSGIID